MDPKLLPRSREGKLDRLIEECAEVIKCVCKLRRFGTTVHVHEGIEYDNLADLEREIEDLEHAIRAVKAS